MCMRQTVSCIIPAFNEERTIAQTVDLAMRHALIDDVLVVCDGCTDRTAAKAAAAGARVIELAEHRGKAHAMQTGIGRATGDVLLFLDSNLALDADAITRLLRPVMEGRYDTQLRRASTSSYKLGDVFVLRGARALDTSVWQAIPAAYKPGYSMELALRSLKRLGSHATYIFAPGLTVFVKEAHQGFFSGLFQRLRFG
jgi:glycosyltransferase involved in cell wall biosynthesis